MESQWLGPLVGAGMITVFVWFIWASMKRKKALQQLAPRLGMAYIGRDEALADSGAKNLPMFAKGEMRCDNVLHGKLPGGECYLFDYTRVRRKPSGKRSSYAKGTHACLRISGNTVPAFRIRPASDGAKGTRVPFPELPAFEEHYVVVSDQPEKVAQLLGPRLLEHLARRADEAWVIETDGEWVGMAQRPRISVSRHVKPEVMRGFKDEVTEIFRELQR